MNFGEEKSRDGRSHERRATPEEAFVKSLLRRGLAGNSDRWLRSRLLCHAMMAYR